MSDKPSRSAIESALAPGRKTRAPKNNSSSSGPSFSDVSGRRRQQVIGGDLGGVTSRQHQGKFAWLRRINVINWVASAIVLIILLAFFWPQANTGSTREIPGQISDLQSESFYSESRIDVQADEPLEIQTFSRESDLERADEYRDQQALERQIDSLLNLAKQQIAAGQYTLPKLDNASHSYKQVLLLAPNHVKAGQGLEYIRNRFLNSGLRALEQDNFTIARGSLEKLQGIDNQSDEASQLAAAIEYRRIENETAVLLASAGKARSDNKLILPARENALYFYQQALILNENNVAAQAGVKSIADEFVQMANQAIVAGELETATSYLSTVSVIDPEHQSLSLLENTITNAKPIAAKVKSQRSAHNRRSQEPRTNSDTQASANSDPLRIETKTVTTRKPTEQETFDRQYLAQGLDAYYKGDYETAVALLQPLADKGVSRAQFRIGYMYYQGRGFITDRDEADRIIRAALPAVQSFADEGRAWAQSDIGSLYEDGLVLPRDNGEAVYWYRSAAEQGYPGAQTNLGIMYARGRGVGTSRRTAIQWFQRAAKQGDILAKRNLESMGIDP